MELAFDNIVNHYHQGISSRKRKKFVDYAHEVGVFIIKRITSGRQTFKGRLSNALMKTHIMHTMFAQCIPKYLKIAELNPVANFG